MMKEQRAGEVNRALRFKYFMCPASEIEHLAPHFVTTINSETTSPFIAGQMYHMKIKLSFDVRRDDNGKK